jgi:hypothetical protein
MSELLEQWKPQLAQSPNPPVDPDQIAALQKVIAVRVEELLMDGVDDPAQSR